jgi:hypothetical protein
MKALKSGKVAGGKDSAGRWTFSHAEVVRWRGEPRADYTEFTPLKVSENSDLKDELIAVLKEQIAIKDTQIADLSEITKNQALRLSAPEDIEPELVLEDETEVITLPDETVKPDLSALMNFNNPSPVEEEITTPPTLKESDPLNAVENSDDAESPSEDAPVEPEETPKSNEAASTPITDPQTDWLFSVVAILIVVVAAGAAADYYFKFGLLQLIGFE